MRIAFFGGSFNPPHRAHREVMECLANLPDFDEAWMVPTYSHAFDKELAPFEDRLRMAELTVAGLGPKAKVSGIEGELKRTPSYTIDVIRELKKAHPGFSFSVVVGSDCRQELPKWKSYDALKREAEFHFIPRPGLEASPFTDVSSTRIRRLIRDGKAAREYLLPEVADYIRDRGLYR